MLLGSASSSFAQTSIFSKQNTAQKEWVGQSAPDFKLQDQSGKWHTLSQYKGKWIVLYFYFYTRKTQNRSMSFLSFAWCVWYFGVSQHDFVKSKVFLSFFQILAGLEFGLLAVCI
jgi:hypothetical protein